MVSLVICHFSSAHHKKKLPHGPFVSNYTTPLTPLFSLATTSFTKEIPIMLAQFSYANLDQDCTYYAKIMPA